MGLLFSSLRYSCCVRPLQMWGIHGVNKREFCLLQDDFSAEVLEDIRTLSTSYDPTQFSNTVDEECGHKFIDYPFLTDDKLGQWIINTRFMFILRGPSGSGKSYIASCIKTRFPTTKICSKDHFWSLSNAGEYIFDESKQDAARKFCLDEASKYAELGESPIVIDNTNVRTWECRMFTALARRCDYNVILVTPKTPWRSDMNALALKNVHNVSKVVTEMMIRQFEQVYPLYYGWFWPGLGSCHTQHFNPNLNPYPCDESEYLISHAYQSFKAVINISSICAQLASECGLNSGTDSNTLADYWNSAVNPSFGTPPTKASRIKQSRPHVTAMFCNMGQAVNSKEYAARKSVKEALLGCLNVLHVAGLFISKRTIGLRVIVDPELYGLWNAKDNESIINQIAAPTVNRPTACRAHATMALASGVLAFETGLDLLRIVDAEMSGRPDASTTQMPDGVIRQLIIPQIETPNNCPEHIYYYQFAEPRAYSLYFGAFY